MKKSLTQYAVFALAIIVYIAMPPDLVKQATALWGGG